MGSVYKTMMTLMEHRFQTSVWATWRSGSSKKAVSTVIFLLYEHRLSCTIILLPAIIWFNLIYTHQRAECKLKRKFCRISIQFIIILVLDFLNPQAKFWSTSWYLFEINIKFSNSFYFQTEVDGGTTIQAQQIGILSV